MISKESVLFAINKLMDELYENLGIVYSYTFHKELQNRLVELADQYGYIGQAEYKIIGKSVDVVWKYNDIVVWAIEIDKRLNENSFIKFNAIKQLGSKTLWISYSKKSETEVKEFLKRCNPDNETIIIRKRLNFKVTERHIQKKQMD